MSTEVNNVTGVASSYTLSEKLQLVYLGNRKTVGGELGVRVGNLVNGATIVPFGGAISGALSLVSTIGGLINIRSNPTKAEEFFRDAKVATAAFTRTVSNTYQALLRVINPGALCEDQHVEAEVGGVDRRYDDTGCVSTNVTIFFDKRIAVLNEAHRGVAARALVVVKTILVVAARVVDLVVGAIAAIISVLALGSYDRANNLAYKSLKIGGLLGDVYDLFKNLYDPSSLGEILDEAAYVTDTNGVYEYPESALGFPSSGTLTPIEEIAPPPQSEETLCGEPFVEIELSQLLPQVLVERDIR